ncbi:hypothetical protein PS685_05217 [Pseudomonas fluorescens]|uniref:Uncharacterized protein n=1 Tax=Pseudomonas fluorescens TaxID=294 RepID=A0A5E7A7K6_PSEFL|nr:hypothetical protein PS685_05217 [Pseudomonas fluorescens]
MQDFGQERRVGFFRVRQHQVGLELVVGVPGPFGALWAARGQLDQGGEFGLQVGDGRVAQQALVGFDIDRLDFFQQVLVLVQAEALVPGRAVFGAVIQARQFAHQVVEGQQLGVALPGLLERCQRALHLGDLHALGGEGQQHAGAPHHGQAQQQDISNTRRAPA